MALAPRTAQTVHPEGGLPVVVDLPGPRAVVRARSVLRVRAHRRGPTRTVRRSVRAGRTGPTGRRVRRVSGPSVRTVLLVSGPSVRRGRMMSVLRSARAGRTDLAGRRVRPVSAPSVPTVLLESVPSVRTVLLASGPSVRRGRTMAVLRSVRAGRIVLTGHRVRPVSAPSVRIVLLASGPSGRRRTITAHRSVRVRTRGPIGRLATARSGRPVSAPIGLLVRPPTAGTVAPARREPARQVRAAR